MSIEREKLARAIFIADNGRAPDPADEWEHAPEARREYARVIADALVPIIREAHAEAWDKGWVERSEYDGAESIPEAPPNPYRDAPDPEAGQ